MESNDERSILEDNFVDGNSSHTAMEETEIDSIAYMRRADDDYIRQKFNDLSSRTIELGTCQLALEHSRLQALAIGQTLQRTTAENTQLKSELSKSQVQLTELETKLKFIAMYEKEDVDAEIKIVQNMLLEAANNEIAALNVANDTLRAEHENTVQIIGDESIRLQSENRAMKDEIHQLSSQLATRAVMYKALTRQYHEETHVHTSVYSDKEKENIELKAKLQHLTEQYETCMKEKTEIQYLYREIVQTKTTLEEQLVQVEEVRTRLNDDLEQAITENRVLQTQVSIYQNSDPEDVQTRLVEEAAEMRRQASAEMDHLRRQLAESQRQVTRFAEEKEQLLSDVHQLTTEVEEKSHLLDQLGHSGTAERSGSSRGQGQGVGENSHQSRSLFHFSDSSVQQHHLQDETISQLSVNSTSPSGKAGTRYAPASTVNHAVGSHHGPGVDPLRSSTDTIETRESTDSWSIHQLGEEDHNGMNAHGANYRDGDEANVLQASREGLPPGIAFHQHNVSVATDVNSVLQSLLVVLEGLVESLHSAAPGQQSLSQVAAQTVSHLIHSDLFTSSGDVDSTVAETLQVTLNKLMKQLVAVVHTHLGAPADKEEAHSFSGTHTHVHFAHTPEAQIRRHQISFEQSADKTAAESDHVQGEKEGNVQGALPHRHQSNDAAQEELIHLKLHFNELRRRYQSTKADLQAAHVFVEHLVSRFPDTLSVHSQQTPGDSALHDATHSTTVNVHGQAHHHRTVHIHSESDLKGSGFTQHQTRDVTMSLESGDNATPSQLHAQLLLLQNSFAAGEAEKAGLVEQLEHCYREIREFESLAANNRNLGRLDADEHYAPVIAALEEQVATLNAKLTTRDEAEAAVKVTELWARVADLQAQLDAAVREKESSMQAMADRDAQISHHETECSRHQAEIAAAAAEVSAHKSHADALQQSLREHEHRVSELQTQLTEAQRKLADLTDHSQQSEAEQVNALRCQITDLEQEKDDLVSKLQTVVRETEVSVLNRLSQTFSEQREADRSALRALEDSTAEQTQRYQTLGEEVKLRRRQNVELEAELHQMQNLLELQQRRANTQENNSHARQVQVEELQAQLLTWTAAESDNSNKILPPSSSVAGAVAPYVLQGHFQETVTSLQIQMEAVKNINTLVVENIRDRISHEDRDAAEREMHALRLELEQKITSVNEQLNRLREQQLLQQEAQGRQLQEALLLQKQQQQAQAEEAARNKALAAANAAATAASASAEPAIPMISLKEHEAQLQAAKEVSHHLQQRLHEIEITNSQLMEHNMTLLRQLQQLQVQLQQHIEGARDGVHEEKEKERERERDNGSVFSIDRSAYQGQVTQLSQQAVLLEQQRMQIERFEENFEVMRQHMNQLRSRYQAKLAKQKEANEEKLRRQQVQFNTERSDLVVLVNEECERIIAEVHTLIQQQFARHGSVECSACGHVNSTMTSGVGGTPETQGFVQATPPLVPPPPPSSRQSTQTQSGSVAAAPSSKPTPPSARQVDAAQRSGHQDSHREHRDPPRETSEPHRTHFAHFEEQHQQHRVVEHLSNAHHEVKHSTEFELRHTEGSSIPVHSSLRGSLTMPAHSAASPARKPINSKTAAIIAAHSRPPTGHHREYPHAQGITPASSHTTPSTFSRLLSSVTSLQSHVSASSQSLQGLTAENVSVLAGPKPSYANPTQAYTSRQRSPTVRSRDVDIHPPSSSGDINAGHRKRSGPSATQTPMHTASPPRRRSNTRSAHNSHSSERGKPAASVLDSQRTVEWARSGEHKSSGNTRSGGSSGGKKAPFVYPESLSPGRTLELVHELVGRSLVQEHQHNQDHEHHEHLHERAREPQRERDSHQHREQREQRDRESRNHRVQHDIARVRSSI